MDQEAEKIIKRKEAKKIYMREYMRSYSSEQRKDTVSYQRGSYVSKYDKLKTT